MFSRILEAVSNYEVILEPDENTPEWWAGAPSVTRGPDGAFYLACRMREGNSPRGKRGYEIRILRSDDGVHFEVINQIKREEAGVPGFERAALLFDQASGRFRLYGCSGLDDLGWSILRWDDADDPAKFEAGTVRTVLHPEQTKDRFARVRCYKDPVIYFDGTLWHMFVIGTDHIERIYHFHSNEGEEWRAASDRPVFDNRNWHDFFTRPASIVPMAAGYLFVYEGSRIGWHDPEYNIATGLAYSPDLRSFADLTPEAPLFKTTTPGDYHTWRYSAWIRVGDKVHVYFEAARPNTTNEVRLGIFDAMDIV